jgi:uncharacterized protein (DUF362 family)
MDFRVKRRTFLKLLSFLSLSYFYNPSKALSGHIRESVIAKSHNIHSSSGKSRVLRIYCRDVVKNYQSPDLYLESINTEILNKMLEEGIRKFTGKQDLKNAWKEILIHYTKNDKVAIKPNFNFLNHGYKYTITSPQLINSVVKQLVEVVGIPPKNIFVYDLCKDIPIDIVRRRINYAINYIEKPTTTSILDKIKLRLHYGLSSADTNVEIKMHESITDKKGNPVKCYIPKVVTQAQHLINMPLLTNHVFIANSGALKNHYGTVRFSNYHNYPGVLHGKVLNKSIIDINLNSHIRTKTKIIIGDGLFGVFDRGDVNIHEGGGKKVWKTFKNDFPESIFISKDPVAIDSVMASIIMQERKMHQLKILSTEYLNDAMNDGLGVYEISENINNFKKIEYVTESV